MFVTNNTEYDMPVAFATNSIYLMAKHNVVCKQTIDNVILPLFMKKADYVHNEGLGHVAFGLAKAEIWNEEAWSTISKLALEKQFDFTVVKNKRWTTSAYVESTKNDHVMQDKFSDFHI